MGWTAGAGGQTKMVINVWVVVGFGYENAFNLRERESKKTRKTTKGYKMEGIQLQWLSVSGSKIVVANRQFSAPPAAAAAALNKLGIWSWESFRRLRKPKPLPATSPISSPSSIGTNFFTPFPSQRTAVSRPACLRHHDTAAAASASEVETSLPHSSLLVKKKAAELSIALKGTSVFLVGMNSSIKSNLGKVIANALRYYYFDSDNLVEEAAGGKSTVRSLIDEGEEVFRESETEVLKQLSSMGRLIVSAGNGAVQRVANLALLRHGITIWIDIPLDFVAREVFEDNIQLPASESTISGSYSEVLTQLTRLYEKCENGYTAADSTVSLLKVASKLGYKDLAEVTAEDIAVEVLRELEKLTRVKKMMEAAAAPF